MKRSTLWIGLLMAALVLAPALAGEEGESCSHETQACLDYMVKNMQNKGWAGLDLEPNEGFTGFVVKEVHDGTPAARAGIRVGDMLIALNGVSVGEENKLKLQELHAQALPGKTFTFTMARGHKDRDLKLTLEPIPETVVARAVGEHMMQHSSIEIASAD